MTRNRRYPARREAERRYPHHVDIPVPSGGLGKRLADMHDWCHDHVAAGGWEQHGHSDDRRDNRGILSGPRTLKAGRQRCASSGPSARSSSELLLLLALAEGCKISEANGPSFL